MSVKVRELELVYLIAAVNSIWETWETKNETARSSTDLPHLLVTL
jgi:hypothetical protein